MSRKLLYVFFLFCSVVFLWGINPGSTGQKGRPAKAEDIQITDNHVKFFVEKSAASGRYSMGIPFENWKNNDSIFVNGELYLVQTDTDGKFYINVKANTDKTYEAVFLGNSIYQSIDGLKSMKFPYSQFWEKTVSNFKGYPMYAAYSEETGNVLNFSDSYAVIDIALKGNGEKLKSIKITNKGDKLIAGTGTYSYNTGSLSLSAGVPYIVLNCTNHGNYINLSDKECHFYIPIIAAQYSEGLNVRISDMDHKMMAFDIEDITLHANQKLEIHKTYSPDEDLVFFEGFDNFVWGGDYVAGRTKSKAYSYTTKNPGTTADTAATGYEESFNKVAYDTPGTGFLQSNTWGDVNNYNLEVSHTMSDAYMTSRGIWDYKYLFRAQEFAGYIAVGAATAYRGIFETPCWKNIDGIRNLSVEFDIAFMANFNDKLDVYIDNSGIIEEVYIDDKKIELNEDNYKYANISSCFIAPNTYFNIASSPTAAKKWHHVTMKVSQATDATSLFIRGNTSVSAKHGFYLDNIEVRQEEKIEENQRGDLRVLYWNIQNGMWSDQGNNYDNFVAWVKKYDPDICVWCEAGSIWETNSNVSLSTANRYLPNKGSSQDTNKGWYELAARYGHNYARLGGKRDNYPQEITSKYPITTLLKITNTDVSSKPVAHGAALQQVNVNGRKFNFITIHPWPQAYGYGVSSANQSESAAKREGDYYREFEMNYVLKSTYLSSTYANLSNWLLVGDMNSISIADNHYYGYDPDTCLFFCQNVVRNKTDFVDVIELKYPNTFLGTTASGRRIDYIYISPDLAPYVKNAYIIKDSWTTITFSGISNFYYPSDHRPILVDFDFSQSTGVNNIKQQTGKTEEARYDITGKKINKETQGINIIKYTDGTTRKVLK